MMRRVPFGSTGEGGGAETLLFLVAVTAGIGAAFAAFDTFETYTKLVMVCRFPSSKISKSFGVRSVTTFPFLVTTTST